MGIDEKLANAKEADWLKEGFSAAEVKAMTTLAKLSACIELRRRDMGMTQKEFADYLGVTQGMVSRWEGREYNFTIKTLVEICEKCGMELSIDIKSPGDSRQDLTVTGFSVALGV